MSRGYPARRRRTPRRRAGGPGRPTTLVGGGSATQYDFDQAIESDLKLIAPIALVVMALILAFLLRAVVAPLLLLASVILSFLCTLGLSVLFIRYVVGDPGFDASIPTFAFIFLVAAYVPGRIKAKVKHPFLVAIKTWALAHLIANGDLASIVLFGSFLAYAVYDRMALKGRTPTELIGTAAQGGARNDLIAIVLGVLFYVIFLIWLHPLLIGRAVVPH